MRILFVHQNFPGQFVHLAPALVRRGHDVRALTLETNQQQSGIERYTYSLAAPEPARGRLSAGLEESIQRGVAVARTAHRLKSEEGLEPEVVFGHVGWGDSLLLKEVWPTAQMLVYAEFYWRARGLHFDFDPAVYPTSFERGLSAAITTASLTATLAAADRAVSPTNWQARSFPDAFQSRISIIHDGIDTSLARPDREASVSIPKRGLEFRPGDEVLTFVNRTLEPHRGYHIFMRALPKVLKARPKAHVVIVGGPGGAGSNSSGYGPPPKGGRSWRDIFLAEVAADLDLARVHFVGKVPHRLFLNLMQVSRAHAYLTYPGVLSWSMLEAMSCGALVVGSRTPPVEEVIADAVNGRLVDFFDVPGWSDTLIDALARPSAYQAMRAAARRSMVERYDLETVCLPKLAAFVEGSSQG